ncbi:hypothetical protein CLOM621_06229 [Clostridium sp. M62/1]|nr:hypothetical protein CLOM621_06229 [Clostridium sp. M62/1]
MPSWYFLCACVEIILSQFCLKNQTFFTPVPPAFLSNVLQSFSEIRLSLQNYSALSRQRR